MASKSVLLIIGGGIAAYKSLLLIRLLTKAGVSVTGILTKGGSEFITPLSVASLTGNKCYTDLFSLTDEVEMGHIELSRSADLVVVAPATADLLGKAANGLANDLASTVLLATDKRVLFAPAMNVRMWEHPAVQRNVCQLTADGALFCGPDIGDMACGEHGPGRLSEPEGICRAILSALDTDQSIPPSNGSLSGRHVLLTAGPTHEPVDPVRFLGNRSSGKQGYAIAKACAALGAKVTLVSGPTSLPDPSGVTTLRVETAREMLSAIEGALPADIAILCAAVADYRPASVAGSKLKKDVSKLNSIALAENPDILATLSKHPDQRPKLVIGFAAETDDVIPNAVAKRARKGCDWIVANDVSAGTDVMGGDANTVTIISAENQATWPTLTKQEVAQRLANVVAEEINR